MRRGSPRVSASWRARSPGHSVRALATSAFAADRFWTCRRAAGAVVTADNAVADGGIADGAVADGAVADGAASMGTSTCPGVPVRGRTAGARERQTCGAGSGADSTSTPGILTSHCRPSAGMVAMSARASFNWRPRILAGDRLHRRCSDNEALRSHLRTICMHLPPRQRAGATAPGNHGTRRRPEAGRTSLRAHRSASSRRHPVPGSVPCGERQPMGLMRKGWRKSCLMP
jgi:hypothetical protein